MLASAVDGVEAFAQLSTELIVTQKTIFPIGVPAPMVEHLVSREELASQYKEVQDLGEHDVLIFDGSAPRSG